MSQQDKEGTHTNAGSGGVGAGPEFVHRVLVAFDDLDAHSALWWKAYADKPVRFFVTCNDFFWWGTSDCEELTAVNLEVLDAAIRDCRAVGAEDEAPMLFCARMRKSRPQGAVYRHIAEPAWPLFDACGPERPTGIGNPHEPLRATPRPPEPATPTDL